MEVHRRRGKSHEEAIRRCQLASSQVPGAIADTELVPGTEEQFINHLVTLFDDLDRNPVKRAVFEAFLAKTAAEIQKTN